MLQTMEAAPASTNGGVDGPSLDEALDLVSSEGCVATAASQWGRHGTSACE
jgi:hypothetical protein